MLLNIFDWIILISPFLNIIELTYAAQVRRVICRVMSTHTISSTALSNVAFKSPSSVSPNFIDISFVANDRTLASEKNCEVEHEHGRRIPAAGFGNNLSWSEGK